MKKKINTYTVALKKVRNYFLYSKEKRRKRLIGLAFCLMITSILLFYLVKYVSEDSSSVRDIRITNVTGTSATVTWITDKPVRGSILYSTSNSWDFLSKSFVKKQAYDDRDIEEVEYGEYELKEWGEYYVHHVTLRDLEPNTRYFYRISTGMKTASVDYPSLETAGVLAEPIEPFAAYGRVLSITGDIAEEVIVYFWMSSDDGKSQMLSTVTSDYSGWSLDIGNIRTDSLDKLYDRKMAKVYIEAQAAWDKNELWEVSTGRLQPCEDIILTKTNSENQNSFLEKIIEPVYASACTSYSDFINECMSGSKNPDGSDRTHSDCEALDYCGWVAENCGGTRPPECDGGEPTPTGPTPPEEPSSDSIKYSGDGWCGAGDYCINNSLYNCDSNQNCTLKDSCAYGCSSQQVCTNDYCHRSGDEGASPPSGGTVCNYNIYNGSGECINGILKRNGQTVSPQTWCAPECGDDQVTVEYDSPCCNGEDICSCSKQTAKVEKGAGKVGSPDPDHKYDCGDDAVLYDLTLGKATEWQSWCGEFVDPEQTQSNCPYTVSLHYDGCNGKPLCSCGVDEGAKQEGEVEEYDSKCDIGDDGWETVTKYHELLEEHIPDGLAVGAGRRIKEGDNEYLVHCKHGSVTSDWEPGQHWFVKAVKISEQTSCDEVGFEGFPEGTIIRSAVTNQIMICDGEKAYIVETFPEEYMRACRTVHNGFAEADGHYFNCSIEAFLAGSYHSYTPFRSAGDDCVLTYGLEDCRAECECLFGNCNGSHRSACSEAEFTQDRCQNIFSNSIYQNQVFNNCMYGFSCIDGECIDVNSDEDGDGIPYHKDPYPKDPCKPYDDRVEGCSGGGDVPIAPVGGMAYTYHDITSGDVGEERTKTMVAAVLDEYPEDLRDSCRYDDEGNLVTCKNTVWAHQTGLEEDTAEAYLKYLDDNATDENGDAIGVGFIVAKNGEIYQTGPVDYVFPHAGYGDHTGNMKGIPIESAGASGKRMTDAQFASVVRIVSDLYTMGVIPSRCSIVGHSERSPNPDPGEENMEELRERLGCSEPVADIDESTTQEMQSKGLIAQVEAEELELSSEVEITSGVIRLGEDSKVFWDMNRNGKFDPIEKTASVSDIQNLKLKDATVYSLKKGWNAINIPVYTNVEGGSNIISAKGLIDEINSQGLYVTHLATYREGRWVVYSQRGNVSFSNDFNIYPGEGYFIRSHSAGDILIRGSEFEDSVPLDLQVGWNLVGVISPSDEYSAEGLLQKIGSKGIEADTITKWDSGRYYNFIREKGITYGNDFKLFETGAYFVRVKKNGGRFIP